VECNCNIILCTGANLWLAARNKEKLGETADQCKALGAEEVVIIGVWLPVHIDLDSESLPSIM
jgi:NADP-dependent 3-hydroxy acid dehydrogenase YdfG